MKTGKRLMKKLAALAGAGVCLCPAPLLACAACFGGPDQPLTKGMGAGILSLMAVTASVLGAFTMFFVYLGRKAASTNKEVNHVQKDHDVISLKDAVAKQGGFP
jgi:hypothetical protein